MSAGLLPLQDFEGLWKDRIAPGVGKGVVFFPARSVWLVSLRSWIGEIVRDFGFDEVTLKRGCGIERGEEMEQPNGVRTRIRSAA